MLNVNVMWNQYGTIVSLHPFLAASIVTATPIIDDAYNRERVLIARDDEVLTALAAKWGEDFEHLSIEKREITTEDFGHMLLIGMMSKEQIPRPRHSATHVFRYLKDGQKRREEDKIPLTMRVWLAFNLFIHHQDPGATKVLGMSDGALMLDCNGMIVGIEPDGYTHS